MNTLSTTVFLVASVAALSTKVGLAPRHRHTRVNAAESLAPRAATISWRAIPPVMKVLVGLDSSPVARLFGYSLVSLVKVSSNSAANGSPPSSSLIRAMAFLAVPSVWEINPYRISNSLPAADEMLTCAASCVGPLSTVHLPTQLYPSHQVPFVGVRIGMSIPSQPRSRWRRTFGVSCSERV